MNDIAIPVPGTTWLASRPADTTAALPPKKVHLQMQRVGLVWVNVITFDASNELAEHYVRGAVESLCDAEAPGQLWPARFRIVDWRGEAVLTTYSAADGWRLGGED